MTPDWNRIRTRYEQGDSARAIARDSTEAGAKISHTAINKRARREGWKRPDEDGNPATAAARYLEMPRDDQHRPVMFNKDTPATRAAILQDIESGLTLKLACQHAGVSIESAERWKEADGDFAAEIARAEARKVNRRLSRIEEAGKRGDWKADAWLVERSPESKPEFGNANERNAGFGQINVILNVPVPEPVVMPETIEARAISKG